MNKHMYDDNRKLLYGNVAPQRKATSMCTQTTAEMFKL